jgi:hypothetical protein
MGTAVFVAAALLVIGLAIAYVGRDRIEELMVGPAPSGTPVPADVALSSDEREFYDFVGPRMQTLTAEAQVLDTMGKERSRNLVELQVRSERVTSLLDELDGYLVRNPAPSRMQSVVDAYHEAAANLRSGMKDARAAVLKFDWNEVAKGLDLFSQGTDKLSTANDLLRTLVGKSATPVPAAAA